MQLSCLAWRYFTPFVALTVVGSKKDILTNFPKRNPFQLRVTQDGLQDKV